jgi:hypothetical protein
VFKITVALFMLVVDYNTIGGYRERPELLEDEAVGYLSTTQNLLLKHHRVIRVQTQVVK